MSETTEKLRLAAREYANEWGAAAELCGLMFAASDELDAMTAERDKWKAAANTLADDWAETDSYVRMVALNYFTGGEVNGDAYGVPPVERIVDLMAHEITTLRLRVEAIMRGEFICLKCGLHLSKGDF